MTSLPTTPTRLFRAGFNRLNEIALEGYRTVTVLRTPDRQEPDRLFIREMAHRDLLLPVNVAGGDTMEIEI